MYSPVTDKSPFLGKRETAPLEQAPEKAMGENFLVRNLSRKDPGSAHTNANSVPDATRQKRTSIVLI
jgi:hypothetical protein